MYVSLYIYLQKEATSSRGLRGSGIQHAVRSAGHAQHAQERAPQKGKKRPQSLNSAEGAGERDEVLSSIERESLEHLCALRESLEHP
jgi:hypothetical protein